MKVKRTLAMAQRQQLQAMTPPKSGRCNAILKSGKRCLAKTGSRTLHPGVGPCAMHETSKKPYDSTARYRHAIREGTVRAQLVKLGKTEDDILDLAPEVQMMRALIIDFVNNYDETTNALILWFRDQGTRPKGIPDLAQAAQLLEAVSRMVERIHRIQTTGSISLDMFRRVMEEMGVVVARHVRHGETLDAIEQDWSRIQAVDKTRPSELPEPVGTPALPSNMTDRKQS